MLKTQHYTGIYAHFKPNLLLFFPPADIAPYGGDGLVDFKDLDLLIDHWLEGAAP